MSWPRASWFSSFLLSPARLSEPVITQFVPAEVNATGVSASTLVSLELTLKQTATATTTISATRPARMARMRRGRSHRRHPLRPGTRYPPRPPPEPERDGGCDGHAVRSGPATLCELALPGAYQPSPGEPCLGAPCLGAPGAGRGVKPGCPGRPAPRGCSGSSLYHPRGQSLLIAA